MKKTIRIAAATLLVLAFGIYIFNRSPAEPDVIYRYVYITVEPYDEEPLPDAGPYPDHPDHPDHPLRPRLYATRITPYVMPHEYVYALAEMLHPFANNIAVFYKNMDTGFTYIHNKYEVFFSASVPKAFFSLYIYMKAERGEVDLDSFLTYINADFHGGSGVIQERYLPGARFAQRELLRLNLSYSDNIATNILRREHGVAGYRQFVADMGGNPEHVRNLIFNSLLTVSDAGLLAGEMFRYIESGGRYSEEFRAHLLDNRYPFLVSDYPVASKTGWSRPSAWHDVAIVYSPSPYILAVLSRREGWTERDYRDFYEISMAFQEFNDTWFVLFSESAPDEVGDGVSPVDDESAYTTLPEGTENRQDEPKEGESEEGESIENELEGDEPEGDEHEETPRRGFTSVMRVIVIGLTAGGLLMFALSFTIKKENIIILEGADSCCMYHRIKYNHKRYLGKKIQLDGTFTTENIRNNTAIHMISRDVTTPCGSGENFYFELNLSGNPPPAQQEWVRVTGTLQEYKRGNRTRAWLAVNKIQPIKK